MMAPTPKEKKEKRDEELRQQYFKDLRTLRDTAPETYEIVRAINSKADVPIEDEISFWSEKMKEWKR